MKRNNRIKLILVYMVVIVFGLTFMLPFYWLIRSSLMTLGQVFIIPPDWIPDPFAWDNYSRAISMVPFPTYFKNTILVVVAGVSGTLITSSLVAYGYSRIKWKFRQFFFALSLSSMMLPGAVTLIPTFLGYQKVGLYNSLWPLFLPAWFGGGAFNIFLLRQFIMGIPRELDEAAYIDGAGHFRIYFNVIVPLTRSALIVVGLFSFLYYWNDFFTPLIYLEDTSKFTVAVGLRQFVGQYVAQWPLLMAASTLATLPTVIVFICGQKYFIKGIVMSGIKG
jgi:multiple sugar transport system permease protein